MYLDTLPTITLILFLSLGARPTAVASSSFSLAQFEAGCASSADGATALAPSKFEGAAVTALPKSDGGSVFPRYFLLVGCTCAVCWFSALPGSLLVGCPLTA
uniref:Secreted protein n=1 Tax=Ixodes ricinus TaxID=34613 RepID=A0A6B0UIE8_IXORI